MWIGFCRSTSAEGPLQGKQSKTLVLRYPSYARWHNLACFCGCSRVNRDACSAVKGCCFAIAFWEYDGAYTAALRTRVLRSTLCMQSKNAWQRTYGATWRFLRIHSAAVLSLTLPHAYIESLPCLAYAQFGLIVSPGIRTQVHSSLHRVVLLYLLDTSFECALFCF